MWNAFDAVGETVLEQIALLPRPLRSPALGAVAGIVILWFMVLARAGGLIGGAAVTVVAVFSFGWKGLFVLPIAAALVIPGGALAGIVHTLLAPLRRNRLGLFLAMSLAVATYLEVTALFVWLLLPDDGLAFNDPMSHAFIGLMSVAFGIVLGKVLEQVGEDDAIDWDEFRPVSVSDQIEEAVTADLAELRRRATVNSRYTTDLRLISRNEPSAQLVMHWWRVRRHLVPAYGPAFGRTRAAIRRVEQQLAHERRRWAAVLEAGSPQRAA